MVSVDMTLHGKEERRKVRLMKEDERKARNEASKRQGKTHFS